MTEQPIKSDVPPGLPEETTPEGKTWREKLKENMGKPTPKSYPPYAQFCDDPEEQTGFKAARISRWLAENEHFKTDRETDILYYGDKAKGVWTRDGETKLREILSEILDENDKVSHYNNILHALKGLTYCDVEFSQKIAVENGLLDVETRELTPFTLEEMAFYQLETAYNKEAVSEHWQEFLKQVLNPEDVPTLQEWSGYLLLPDYRFHKLLWIHGEGRNGKGVWQRTMEAILGEKNVSSLGLEEFDGNHRFAMERLYGKLFNPCSEPTTNRILQTALLKKATGQDLIEAEIKGKQKRVKFRNCAKITIIANKFPKVRDSTTAFRERRLFVKFPFEFIGKDCVTNLERVWLDDPLERMGILNWMLEGLQRLLANGCFTESKSQEETEIAFERASDTISAFLTEMAIFDKNLVTTRSDAYSAYKEYCDYHGLDNESDKKFTQRLKETPRVSVTTVSKPKRERAWQGLGLKQLNDDGTIIDVTGVTDSRGISPLSNFSNNKKIGKSRERVTSVTSVTEQRSCGDCELFHKPSCVFPSMNFNKVPEDSNFALDCRSFTPKKEAS
jgi:putative DNA primase/helicase